MALDENVVKFNEEGCLENKIYEMDLSDVKKLFSKNKSQRREYIMENYIQYLEELLSTGYVVKHWIDGSFVTLKEEPNDIDIFTVFDGIAVDRDNKRNELQKLIDYAPLKTDYCCHSLCAFYYPSKYEKEHESYINTKNTTLDLLFATNKETSNPKGFIELRMFEGGEVDDI